VTDQPDQPVQPDQPRRPGQPRPDGHPAREVLQDLASQAPGAPATEPALAAAAGHVAGCDQCRGYLDDLAAVSLLLRSPALDPGPLPPDVADRVTAALAAEQRTRPRPDVPAPATVTALHRPPGARRRRWRAGLLAAAAVAAVALVVPSFVSVSGRGEDSAAGGAANQESAPADTPGPLDPAAEAARDLVAAADARRAATGSPPQAVPDASAGLDSAGDVAGSPGCGGALAAEVGGRLLASTAYEAAVLVVVAYPSGALEYLVVPSCTSPAGDVQARGPVPS
jgi:hypothetical protein